MKANSNRFYRILLIEDSETDRQAVAQYLRQRPTTAYQLLHAETGQQGLELCAADIDCVLLDHQLPGCDGNEVLRQLRTTYPYLPIVVMTHAADEQGAVQCLKLGAEDYLNKRSLTAEYLERTIRYAYQQAQHRRQFDAQQAELEATNQRLRREVAERKATEAELREREVQLRLITEHLPALIAHVGADLRYRFVNRCYEQWHGVPAEKIVGRHVRELLGDGNYEKVKDQIRLVLSGQQTTFQNDIVNPRTGPRSVVTTYVPEIDSKGEVVGFFSTVFDQTDVRRAVAKFNDSERRFRQLAGVVPQMVLAARAEGFLDYLDQDELAESVIETAGAIVVVLDPQGQIMRLNRFLEEVSGYELEEVQGRDWFATFLPAEDHHGARKAFAQAISNQPCRGRVAPIITKQGWRREFSWWERPIRDTEGNITGLLLLGHDVTELYEAQKRALQAERLAAIGEAMTALAHESRNALQRSQANLEMLMRDVEDRPQAIQFIRRIQKAQDDLHQLYEDVREYAKPIRVNPQPADLRAIVRETWEQIAPVRAGRSVELIEHLRCSDLQCEVDCFGMRQVFRNILENSLAAAVDPVKIDATYEATELGGEPALEIRLRDNGPGFSAEVQQRIFDVFFTTKTHGTGLGMAIARRLVEAHHGQIAVRSEPQHGAEFVITLRRRRR